MDNMTVESSSDEDDIYANAVARLKVLKKQRLEKEKLEEEKCLEKEKFEEEKGLEKEKLEEEKCLKKEELTNVKVIEATSNNDENIKRIETRSIRYKDRLRRRNNIGERHPFIDNTACDVEIISMEKIDSVPKSPDVECSDTITLLSDDDVCGEDDNYEMNVKVLWRSRRMDFLSMRRYDSFFKIFQHYADLEKVSLDKIMIMRRDKIISCTDTPASLKLSVIDILDGGIVDVGVTMLCKNTNKNDDEICSIKVQTANKKKPLTTSLRRDQQFKTLFVNCAQQLGLNEATLKFYFDGEQIDATDTPESLDLEGEACIDLHISSA